MDKLFLIFYLLGVQLVHLTSAEKKGFILIAPSRIHGGELICVKLYNNTVSESLSVVLLEHKSDTIISSAETVITQTRSCLPIVIPQPTFASLARLEVSISNDDNSFLSKTSRTVHLLPEPWLTLISTDKPIYGANDVVRIRVFIVDRDLNPLSDVVDKLWVENPQGVHVFEKTYLSPVYGVIEASFQLVNDPFPGEWKVNLLKNGYSTVRTFLVQKHAIPSFYVSIIAPRSMEENTHTEIKVCAKYTFGKPVQGSVQVSMAVVCAFEYYCKNEPEAFLLNMTLNADGCAGEKLMAERTNEPYLQHVVLNATVRELGTDLLAETSQKIVLLPVGARSMIKGAFRMISDRIKPGLPFYGDLVLTSQVRKWNSINVTLCRSFDNEKVCTVYETHDGVIPFTVPPNRPAEKIFIEALWTNTDGKNSSAVAFLRPWVSPSSNFVQILVNQTANLECDKELTFRVLHTFPVGQEFIVMMKSRGNIVMFENASLSMNFHEGDYEDNSLGRLPLGSATVQTPIRFISFSLYSTAYLSPEASLVIFTTSGDEVVADSVLLRFQQCFKFPIHAEWNKLEARPGDDVMLSITTGPETYCAVNGVDSKVHLLEKKSNSLHSRIFQQLALKFPTAYPGVHDYDRCVKQTERYSQGDNFLSREPKSVFSDSLEAFESSGLIVMTDLTLLSRQCINSNEIEPRNWESANMSFLERPNVWDDEISNEIPVEQPDISLRTEFPDVFLWENFINGADSTTGIRLRLPGTITEWTTEVVCLSARSGMSITNPIAIRSFKPFFVHFSLPASFHRHEKMHLSVSVFNYMNTSAPIMLTIVPSKHFHIRGHLKTSMCVQANQKLVHFFQVVAVKLGSARLVVKGEIDPHVAEDCGPVLHPLIIDIVEKSTVVKAEGDPVEEIQSGVICGNDLKQPNQTGWNIKMSSAEYVPDSISCKVRVSGDLLGSAIAGVENLVQKPTGCGEQTAMMFVINRMIGKYLSGRTELSELIQNHVSKASEASSLGYQKILSFRHPDGSFSAFGSDSGSGGSIWLTSFLLPHLRMSVGNETIAELAKKWVLNQQLENGCFPKIGEIYHWNNKRGDSPIALTAFIIISLLGSELSPENSAIKNALHCIKAPQETDTYSEILTAYAIALAGDKREASGRMRKLLNDAKRSFDTLWWDDSETETLESSIEMTSYAVLALIELDLTAAAADAVRWIIQFQNQNGGFVSTQDTLMALTALAKFSDSLPESRNALNITAKYDSTENALEITNQNRQLLRTFDIPPFSTRIEFEALGDGCALIQTVLKYNVRKIKHGKTLKIELKVDALKSLESFSVQRVEACIKTGPRIPRTNMAILEIHLPSGFYPDRASLYQTTVSHKGVKKFEEFEDHVVFYLNKLTNHKRCVSFLIKSENCVENPAPFLAKVYDYYNSHYSSSVRQKIQQSCNESNAIDPLPNLSLRRRRNADEPGGLFSNFREVSHDLETPNEIGNGFKLYAMPPPSSKDYEKCPRCLNESPSIFPKLYCSSQVAAQIRFRSKNLLDVMKDVSPQTNFTKIQRSVAFSVKHNCSCNLISSGSKVLMLVTPPRTFNLRSIQIFHIDDNITLIPWKNVVRFIEHISDSPNSCMEILTSD